MSQEMASTGAALLLYEQFGPLPKWVLGCWCGAACLAATVHRMPHAHW